MSSIMIKDYNNDDSNIDTPSYNNLYMADPLKESNHSKRRKKRKNQSLIESVVIGEVQSSTFCCATSKDSKNKNSKCEIF